MSIVCVTDAELVALARQGDHQAYGELVDRHRLAVYRAALAAVGSAPEAEDAAQDAFVTAYRRLGTFRGEASFKTWLLTIAWNHAINRRRRLTRWLSRFGARPPNAPRSQQWNEAGMTSVEDVQDSRPLPEQAAAGAQLRRDIAAEIRALTPKLRDALLLAQSGDHSYDEIATMLQTPTGTVKWRVSEARRLIKKRLRARGYADVG
jgi:RNA polymerase sigma-70 factor (ECF subfamily)